MRRGGDASAGARRRKEDGRRWKEGGRRWGWSILSRWLASTTWQEIGESMKRWRIWIEELWEGRKKVLGFEHPESGRGASRSGKV
jgi:hypothetical protein